MSLVYFQLKGETFIAGANRDTYTGKSAKQIKETLISIETAEGPTAAVIKKGSSGLVHTVTSTLSGYLFGECLWEYLKKEMGRSAGDSIIFCEEKRNESECYLVIVSQGVVIYDAIIPPSQIDEFVSDTIKNSGESFNIIVYGNTPFPAENELGSSIGDIVLEPELIKSYTVLDSPCIDHVLPLKRYLLLPIPSALIKARMAIPKGAIYIILLASFLGYMAYETIVPEEVVKQVTKAVTVVDHYVGFNDKLTTPTHKDILNAMGRAHEELVTLPGVSIQKIYFQHGQGNLTVTANITEASHAQINELLTTSPWEVNFINGQVFFTKDILLKNRQKPTQIYPIKAVLPMVLDGVYLIDGTLSVGDEGATRHYKERTLTIKYEEDYFPSYKTDEIITKFTTLPLHIKSVDVTFTSRSRSEVTTNASLLGE